jgi:hypothetical protein
VLALADVVHLLADEFTGLRARGLSLPLVAPRTPQRFLFRHVDPSVNRVHSAFQPTGHGQEQINRNVESRARIDNCVLSGVLMASALGGSHTRQRRQREGVPVLRCERALPPRGRKRPDCRFPWGRSTFVSIQRSRGFARRSVDWVNVHAAIRAFPR